MKKTYIKPEIEIFQFAPNEAMLANSPAFDLDKDKESVEDESGVWSNKRDWSDTDSKNFWK